MTEDCSLDYSLGQLLQLTAGPGNSNASVEALSRSLEKCRSCKVAHCPGLGFALIEATLAEAQEECDEAMPAAARQALPQPAASAA